MTYHYKATKGFSDRELLSLYDSVDWHAYTKDLAGLQLAIKNSLAVHSVWYEEELVGLIRIVGDGQTIIYVQDLLVKPTHQREGLGSSLLRQVLEEYEHVRQKVLLTEESPKTRQFYEKHGLVSCDQGQAVAFAILN